MRSSISAQSAASTPPASERMVTSASRASYLPESRVRTSSSSIALLQRGHLGLDLGVCESASSVVLGGQLPQHLRVVDAAAQLARRRRISPCTWESREVTCCALSWSFQRSGSEACRSSSSASLLQLRRRRRLPRSSRASRTVPSDRRARPRRSRVRGRRLRQLAKPRQHLLAIEGEEPLGTGARLPAAHLRDVHLVDAGLGVRAERVDVPVDVGARRRSSRVSSLR